MTLLINIKAMDDQSVSILRYFGLRAGQNLRHHLHAQVFMQGSKGQTTGRGP
jgi:hypothetical protein